MLSDMDFVREVESVVNAIPYGKVLTYGDVATLAGRPSNARQVGRILGCFGFKSAVPCHRVVNFEGRTAPHWPEQINLLKREGVTFTKGGFVKLKIHRWKPEYEE